MKDDKWIITFELSTQGIAQWTQDELKHSVEHALRKYFLNLPHKILKVEKDESRS